MKTSSSGAPKPANSTRLYGWVNERLDLDEILAFAKKKQVPEHKHSFWYYWGGLSLFFFLIQLATGILLLVYYKPGPEAYDSVRENLAITDANGACAMIHSDDANGIQRLNQEVAKALSDGRRAGIEISDGEAWAWLSSNPAQALGIGDETGSLQEGYRADVVLWSGNPYSTYTRADRVWIDGALAYDRSDSDTQPVSDFMIGQPGEGAQ